MISKQILVVLRGFIVMLSNSTRGGVSDLTESIVGGALQSFSKMSGSLKDRYSGLAIA